MKKRLFSLILLALLSVPLVVAFAHPGDTDENGGHYDNDTGEYHYHHGYPAHLHTNGVCPYDFDDRTGENSGTPGGSGRVETTRSETTMKTYDITTKKKRSFGEWLVDIITWLAIVLPIAMILICILCHIYFSVSGFVTKKILERSDSSNTEQKE